MAKSTNSRQTMRSIRLDDAQLGRILDALDNDNDDASPGRLNRTATRYCYRTKTAVVHLQQPGGGESSAFLVPTRDLSEGGLSFLHGGFVHAGTRCVAQLITMQGIWKNVTARVVRCRHIANTVHEVSLRFDRSINPAEYCPDAAHSRVLLVEDDSATARLTIHYLNQLNAQVDHAEDGNAAVEKALHKPYDLILMDMSMPVLDGFDATRRLRSEGYSFTIVAVTALTGPGDGERCIDAGCDRYMPKPITPDDLAELLDSLRQEPLLSSYADEPAMTKPVADFVAALREKMRELEQAISRSETESVKKLCQLLKGEGKSYGFEIISQSAGDIEDALQAGKPIAEMRDAVQQLVRLCMQARTSLVNATPCVGSDAPSS